MQIDLSRAKSEMEPGQNSAYNKTRDCFLALQVVAGDFSPAILTRWMQLLKANSGAGIWLLPFRGLAPTEVRAPLDLVYLDANCRVLEAVEFFPTFRVSPSCPTAASVLVLPSHSIYSSATQAGDQLMICPAKDLEWHLQQLARTETAGADVLPSHAQTPLGPVLVREEPRDYGHPLLIRPQPEKPIDPPPQPREAAVVLPQAPPSPAELPAPAQQPQQQPDEPWMDPARQAGKPRGWLGRLLFPGPPDPREIGRLPVSGLVAHFFTGGAPHAHEIRDISTIGLYVVTTERWYPGTIIRMTLTALDSGQAPSRRSITVHARAVRWGNDGVGLEFVVASPNRRGHGEPSALDPVDGTQLQHFLKRFLRKKHY